VDAQEVLERADEAELRLVRFLWCGNDGTIRAKASGLRGLADHLATGIGVTVAMQAMNSLDELQPIDGMGRVGEIRSHPTSTRFASHRTHPIRACCCATNSRWIEARRRCASGRS